MWTMPKLIDLSYGHYTLAFVAFQTIKKSWKHHHINIETHSPFGFGAHYADELRATEDREKAVMLKVGVKVIRSDNKLIRMRCLRLKTT